MHCVSGLAIAAAANNDALIGLRVSSKSGHKVEVLVFSKLR